MIFYFSGCGNSRWLAESLAESIDDKVIFIPDEMDKDAVYEFRQDERLGFVFPVYAWAPPRIVTDFVKAMRFTGEPSYVFMACTCGDETGLTEVLFRKTLKQKGLNLDAAFSFIMPETYINLPGFQLDTIENESRKVDAAKLRLPMVASRIKECVSCSDMNIGKASWLKSRLVQPMFQCFLISDKPFRVESSCIGCGKCAEACPVGNIVMKDSKPLWEHHCVGCMACYHHCPENAIRFGRQTIGKGQYYYGMRQ